MQLSNNQIINFLNKVNFSEEENDCWEWTGCKTTNGYGRVNINSNVYLAHRLVAYFFLDLKEPRTDKRGACGELVLHKCDNPSCLNPSHLFVGTQEENMKDCKEKGRRPDLKGDNNPRWKGGLPKCVECGSSTKDYKSTRCAECFYNRGSNIK